MIVPELNRDIWRHIALYLDYQDFKSLTLVAKCCNFTFDQLFWQWQINQEFSCTINPILPYYLIYRKLAKFNFGNMVGKCRIIHAKLYINGIHKLPQFIKGDLYQTCDRDWYIYNGSKIEELGKVLPRSITVIEEFPLDYWSNVLNKGYQCYFDLTPYLGQVFGNVEVRKSQCYSYFIDWKSTKYSVEYRKEADISGLQLWTYRGGNTIYKL